ncbi:SDR family oxidoreductase [Saccharopolyspora taberi]|uniref:SDR family oxidoreductase n=1 Tax=Saccharopolyspora taberi TaxID=60895 RepID=UPI0031CE2DA5
MSEGNGCSVVVGGTAGLGLRVAAALAERGEEVVVCGRDAGRADAAAASIGATARGLAVDLARPAGIADALSTVGTVRHLVVTAVERDPNTVREFDIASASRLVTMKLVGYVEVVHALAARMRADASIVLVGGLARDRPRPGSTTMTTVTGGVGALVRSLAAELAPIRVNAVHPGLIGDSPHWADRQDVLGATRARVPTGRLVTLGDVVDAVEFLLRNGSMNGANLTIDGGESIS